MYSPIHAVIHQSLPTDVSITDIFGCDNSMYAGLGMEEMIVALRNCKRLNWRNYLERYDDVRHANIDPVEHFIKHGIYENRNIYSYPKEICEFPVSENPDDNKVSIVVPNFNNGEFLPSAIASLLEQTLPAIEIIIIDDCSEDNSVQIINSFMQRDNRIKLIKLTVNSSQHMARKIGVAASNAEYIMFMDPDDAYSPEACKIAYEHVIQGYDMVNFKINVPQNPILSERERLEAESWHNKVKETIYDREQILDSALLEDGINISLVTKIISAPICKKCFAELDDGYFTNWEDLYAFMAIANRTRYMKVIPDRLYIYNRGKGCSVFKESNYSRKRYMSIGKIIEPLERYCEANMLNKYKSANKLRLFNSSYYSFLEDDDNVMAWEWITELAKQFGITYLIKEMLKASFYDHVRIGKKLASHKCDFRRPVKSIAILFNSKYIYERQDSVSTLKNILSSLGYKIYLFVEESHISYMQSIEIDYKLSKTFGTLHDNLQHIDDLYKGLHKYNVDIVMYMEAHSHMLLWDAILCHLLGIQVYAILDQYLLNSLFYKNRKYTHKSILTSLMNCEMTFSTSPQIIDYCRINGIKTKLLSLPSNTAIAKYGRVHGDICIYGYAGEIHISDKIIELLAIADVIYSRIGMMTLIIGYNSYIGEIHAEINALIADRNRPYRVILQDATQNYASMIAKSTLLISTAEPVEYIGIFLTAQQMAVPIVMYEMDSIAKNQGHVSCFKPGEHGLMAEKALCIIAAGEQLTSRDCSKTACAGQERSCAMQLQAIITKDGENVPDNVISIRTVNTLMANIADLFI